MRRPGAAGMPEMLPVIELQWTDLPQGTLTNTGNPLHLALSGKGFYSVQGPKWTSVYAQRQFSTTSGNCSSRKDGKRL